MRNTTPAQRIIRTVLAYTRYLDALDNDDFDSIFAGIQYFKSHLTKHSETVRDFYKEHQVQNIP